MSHPTAPSDADAATAWERIMKIAREHALVVQAAGGVAMLAVPEEQRSAGLRQKVLAMHRMQECRGDQEELDL